MEKYQNIFKSVGVAVLGGFLAIVKIYFFKNR